MDHDAILLLAGAGIALISSVATVLVAHRLSLREDKIKRERDRADAEREMAENQRRLFDEISARQLKGEWVDPPPQTVILTRSAFEERKKGSKGDS